MLSSLKTNNTPVMVTQSVNITLPNVTNTAVQTYTQSETYIDENGNLCSNGTPVSTENHTHDEYVNITYSDTEPTVQRVGDLWCRDYE